MTKTEVQFSDVSYQLSRVFIGSRPASEVLIDHIIRQAMEETVFDAAEIPAV